MSNSNELDILKQLKKNRPDLSDSSSQAYLSSLRTIYNKTKNFGEELTPKYFIDNADRVLKYLSELKNTTRKTKLASLVVLCGNNEVCKQYRTPMMDDIKEVEEQIALNKKNPREKENWISQEEVKSLFEQYENHIKPIATKIRKNEKLTKTELMVFQDFITLALYVLQAPRRIIDYTKMRIKNANPKTDNHIKRDVFVFNNYKTKKSFGSQEVKINPVLLKYLKLWMKVNPTEFLLFDTKFTQLSQPQLSMRLNSIFGKKISVNLLRHIYITDELGDKIQELQEKADEMGHGRDTQATYVKRD